MINAVKVAHETYGLDIFDTKMRKNRFLIKKIGLSSGKLCIKVSNLELIYQPFELNIYVKIVRSVSYDNTVKVVYRT